MELGVYLAAVGCVVVQVYTVYLWSVRRIVNIENRVVFEVFILIGSCELALLRRSIAFQLLILH